MCSIRDLASRRCFFYLRQVDVNGSRRLSPTPSVSNLSLKLGLYLSMVTRSSNQGSVDGFRREGLQRLVTFDLLSVQMRLEERLRMESRTIWCVYGIWRWLETMEQFTAVFLRWIRIVRFAGVPNLGKAYIERENRVQYNPQNHHKSAHGPHRRDVTHFM